MGRNVKGRSGLRGKIASFIVACGSALAPSFAATITYDWSVNAPGLLDWAVTQEQPGATVANGDSGVLVNQFASRGTTGVGQNQLDIDGEPDGLVQDGLHSTLILTSPVFYLVPTTEFSFLLSGGAVGTSPNADFSNITAIIDTFTDNGGFAGVCLRNVATGDYILRISKTLDGPDEEWVGWTAGDLAASGADLSGTTAYVLDLVDKKDGAWGWVKMMQAQVNDVAINPVPEPAVYPLLIAGLFGLRLHRYRFRGAAAAQAVARKFSITPNRPGAC